MDNRSILLLIIISSIFAFAIFSVSAFDTTLLHVSSTLSNTHDLFNGRGLLHSDPPIAFPDPQLISQLHSRLSVYGASAEEEDYTALTLARLLRDSARVNSIKARADLLINFGNKRADLTPTDNLDVPVISGNSQGSGEYFCRLGIGRPATEAYMVLDTGSDVSWVQCAPCSDCYQQTDPIFDPARSSSFAPLACEARQCRSLQVSACRNGNCLYQVSYGDGSYTVGDFATETITFGGSAAVDNVAIGCGHNNEGLFAGAAGLIGLGGGDLSFPSQIKASTFSYCLVDRDSASASTLEFGTAAPPDSVEAPMIRNPRMGTFYYVGLSGIKVSGEVLDIPPETFKLGDSGEGGVIVDSGTAITRLQTAAYESLRDAFKKRTADLPSSNGVALFDTCYDLSSRKSVQVPTVSFQFSNGNELSLPAKNFLVQVDSAGTFCLAFAPTASSPGIIGNVQQQGTRVTFDISKSVIGFSPNKC